MKKIAFFDSGIGGLNVLKIALKILPNEHYIYYADSDHVPYGNKSAEEIKKYVLSAVEFIVDLKIKALVLACNTATSIAIDDLRRRYKFPIIGMEPAIKPALQKCKNIDDKILLLATPLTLQEAKLDNLIASMSATDKIDLLPLPELVTFAEQGDFKSNAVISYIKKKLIHYNLANYQAVVLGCTHFLFFKDLLAKIFPKHTSIIDGCMGTVLRLKDLLTENNLLNKGNDAATIEFYSSGRPCRDSIF
jgi:glutamate racemase